MKHEPPRALLDYIAFVGSQEKAAKCLGVSRVCVTQIANGARPVPARHAVKWANLMRVPLRALRPDMV